MTDDTPLLNKQHLDMISSLTTEKGKNLAEELIEHVTGEGLETFESLVSAIERRDFDTARELSHKLKGMSSNLGMTRLHLRFRDAEDRAKDRTNPPLSGTEIQELRALVHESITAYRAYAISGNGSA